MPKAPKESTPTTQESWDREQAALVAKRLKSLAQTIADRAAAVDALKDRAQEAGEKAKSAEDELGKLCLDGVDFQAIKAAADNLEALLELARHARQELRRGRTAVVTARADLRCLATSVRRPLPLFDGRDQQCASTSTAKS